MALASVNHVSAGGVAAPQSPPDQPPAGAPPTFGTAPAAGPEVTAATFAEAEKLMQISLTPAEREMAAASWRTTLASTMERRAGPRKLAAGARTATC